MIVINQSERRHYLINTLLDENVSYRGMDIPGDDDGQKRLLRSLMNVRMAKPISDEFLKLQDEYLKEELEKSILQR